MDTKKLQEKARKKRKDINISLKRKEKCVNCMHFSEHIKGDEKKIMQLVEQEQKKGGGHNIQSE